MRLQYSLLDCHYQPISHHRHHHHRHPFQFYHGIFYCHKQYASHVEMSKRSWSHRRTLIQSRLLETKADIVCIQEADGSTFTSDFDYMTNELGYDYIYIKSLDSVVPHFIKGISLFVLKRHIKIVH